ncbi:MAG: hypothetical protein J0H01_03955 [Rhizobiales bacterium]|nr:hypothetical protein [Hyphomicrobiales bacterium]
MITYKHSQDCFVASALDQVSATVARAANARRALRFIPAGRQNAPAPTRRPRQKRPAQGWIRAFLREGL